MQQSTNLQMSVGLFYGFLLLKLLIAVNFPKNQFCCRDPSAGKEYFYDKVKKESKFQFGQDFV